MSHLKIIPCGELVFSAASKLAENKENKTLQKPDCILQAPLPACGRSAMPSWQAIRTGWTRCKKVAIRSIRVAAVQAPWLAPKITRSARLTAASNQEGGELIVIFTSNGQIISFTLEAANIEDSDASFESPELREVNCLLKCEPSTYGVLEGCDVRSRCIF